MWINHAVATRNSADRFSKLNWGGTVNFGSRFNGGKVTKPLDYLYNTIEKTITDNVHYRECYCREWTLLWMGHYTENRDNRKWTYRQRDNGHYSHNTPSHLSYPPYQHLWVSVISNGPFPVMANEAMILLDYLGDMLLLIKYPSHCSSCMRVSVWHSDSRIANCYEPFHFIDFKITQLQNCTHVVPAWHATDMTSFLLYNPLLILKSIPFTNHDYEAIFAGRFLYAHANRM